MAEILWPDEIEDDSPVGGKARALLRLTRAELPVPEWCVVLPGAFKRSLSDDQSAAFADCADPDRLGEFLSEIRPSATVIESINKSMVRLSPDRRPMAVRSSAASEDSEAFSFAGQLKSFISVMPEDLPDRVADVWRSGFAENIYTYYREAGLKLPPDAPAVIIQRLIDSDTSGVAFSADPVSGRRTIVVVSAVPGFGDPLVSGETNGDTWRVDRDGEMVEKKIIAKHHAYRRDIKTNQVVCMNVPREDRDKLTLQQDMVREVADLARRAERLFGRPQDIEWAVEGNKLYLLQSRPITTLADRADPDGVLAIWDNSNIVENYGGVTTPLTYSFVRRIYEEVYRDFYRLMGVPNSVIADHTGVFRQMIGLIQGRLYYNLLNWYRSLSLLPGYVLNKGLLEQMLGVSQTVSHDHADNPKMPIPRSRIREFFKTCNAVWTLLSNYVSLHRRVARFRSRVSTALGARRPDISQYRPDELAAYYRRIELSVLAAAGVPAMNDFGVMIFHGLLRKLATAWLGDESGTLQNSLLSNEKNTIGRMLSTQIDNLTETIRAESELLEIFCNGSRQEIEVELRRHPEIRSRISDYLEIYGDRSMDELKLESRTLYDDPTPLFRSIGNLAGRDRKDSASHGENPVLRIEAEKNAQALLKYKPLKRFVLFWVLGDARERLRTREQLRFDRTRLFGRARQVLVEIGKRFWALDLLDDPADVFYLEIEEVMSFVEGWATTTNLRGLVELRKAEYDEFRKSRVPADRIETQGIPYIGNEFFPAGPVAEPGSETAEGVGCSPGIVSGPVRIIRTPEDVHLSHGEIVVAERTDPGWVVLLPTAAGLLVERGNLLSHSAIIAREIALPTIVSIPGLLSWLQDGDWVQMDGTTGEIMKIERGHDA